MSQFGTQYVPSILAVTAASSAVIFEQQQKQRQELIASTLISQEMQKDAVNSLATFTSNSLLDQASAEQNQAFGQMAQGGLGAAGIAGGMGYEATAGFSSEGTQLSNEGKNLSGWKTMLEEGKSKIVSEEDDGIEMRPLQNGQNNERISENQMAALRNKKFSESDPENDPDADLVKMLKSLRSGANDDENNPAGLKTLYDDVAKKLDKEQESNDNKASNLMGRRQRNGDRIMQGFQSLAGMAGATANTFAAQDTKDRAQQEENKTYAEYVNQTLNQSVGTSNQAYSDYGQIQSQTLGNLISGLAQANQPV